MYDFDRKSQNDPVKSDTGIESPPNITSGKLPIASDILTNAQ